MGIGNVTIPSSYSSCTVASLQYLVSFQRYSDILVEHNNPWGKTVANIFTPYSVQIDSAKKVLWLLTAQTRCRQTDRRKCDLSSWAFTTEYSL